MLAHGRENLLGRFAPAHLELMAEGLADLDRMRALRLAA